MSGDPPRDTKDQPEPPVDKGRGCFYGGVAVIGAGLIGGLVSAVLLNAIGQTDIYSGVAATIATLIPLALLAAAAFYGRRLPGFLLGIGLTIAVGAVVGTACAVMLRDQFG